MTLSRIATTSREAAISIAPPPGTTPLDDDRLHRRRCVLRDALALFLDLAGGRTDEYRRRRLACSADDADVFETFILVYPLAFSDKLLQAPRPAS